MSEGRLKALDRLDRIFSEHVRRGLYQQEAQDEHLDGRTLRIAGERLVNFGSCSYLGLELDARLKHAAADAALRFGTHFSSSRIVVAPRLYGELERLLGRIFDGHVLVAPTTTLAHLSALPVLCEEEDALIIDHQVHHSVQMAANQVRARRSHVEQLPHNGLDLLRQRIQTLSLEYRRVWYAGDGVYSMFGDLAPVAQLTKLLHEHEQLHVYLDDAHGVSWRGKHGRGYVLDVAPLHERMVVATTLAKSFGAGGAALVFACEEWRRKVQTCGGPMIFSGPVSPPVLGAAIASATIQLSAELPVLQAALTARIATCNRQLKECALTIAGSPEVPVRFVPVGAESRAQALTAFLMRRGFFTTVATFPAVPLGRAGVRFTLTLHHSPEDIRALVEAIRDGLDEIDKKERYRARIPRHREAEA